MQALVAAWLVAVAAAEHPVYPPQYGPASIDSLRSYVAESMARTPKELYDLVPNASGFYFVGCPNCNGGSQESGVFEYELALGDRVRCRFCKTVFPNEQFPNNRERVIKAPSGIEQVYRWYEAPDGRQHFFEAQAWTQRWQWTQNQAVLLANLYALTGDPEYGDRAAAIVGRYAQVYPDYPVRYDYPFRPKEFYPADQKPPYGDLEPYRGAKFYWWGYADIPERLARAYDLIAAGPSFERMRDLLGDGIRQRVERDLIRLGYEFTSAHRDDYTNMSPGMYHDMIIAGRVIGDPGMVRDAVERFRTLMARKFFFDGWWCEGAPSYHAQTVGNLLRVAEAAEGYVEGETGPETYVPRFTPAEINARIEKEGAEAVMLDLAEHNTGDTVTSEGWNAVMAGIATGDAHWLDVGEKLATVTDGWVGEDIAVNYGRALPKNPERVLRLFPHEDTLEAFLLADPPDVRRPPFNTVEQGATEVNRRIEALQRVTDPELAALRDKAIGLYQKMAADYPQWFKAERPSLPIPLHLTDEVPMLAKAVEVMDDAVLPNGRMIPVNDTWGTDKRKPTDASVSKLWPALGHGVLGAGTGDAQFQVHLNWSGGFGHSHADNASILLYARGRELLSDIGYTHTRYRNWPINTASHNTVVVDMRSQELGHLEQQTTGNLLAFDDANAHVRYIDVDATSAYPACKQYRRRLLHVYAGEGRDYVVDLFEVEGGETHDWFLHGSADEEGTFDSSVAFATSVDSLVPEWGGRAEPQNEQELDVSGDRFHPYFFLRSITATEVSARLTVEWRYGDGGLRTHLFPEGGSTAYHFLSPAIRGAGEIDANLPQHMRHGTMLRHAGPRSLFLAVHEPFQGETWIEGVEWDGATLHVRRATGDDTIRLSHDRATVNSSEGWVYDSGTPYSGTLTAVQREDPLAFQTNRPLPEVTSVRITLGGKQSIVYPIDAVKGDQLLLPYDPGFEYDSQAQECRFLYFPHNTFPGPPNYTVFIGAQ